MAPILNRPPTVPPNVSKKSYGKYCIKAKATVLSKNGLDYLDVTGFDTDMSIITRVDKVAKYKAVSLEMNHTEVQVTFISQGSTLADGTIFANYLDSGDTITYPPTSFQ
jgi:hypothetical protein